MKNVDISVMDREKLLDFLKVIQVKLIDIGDLIKNISETEEAIEKEEKKALSAREEFSPIMKVVFWMLVLILAIATLYEGWGFWGMLIVSLLGGWFLSLVLDFPDELFFNKVKEEKMINYRATYVEPLFVQLDKYSSELDRLLEEEQVQWAFDALQEKYFDLNAVTCFISYLTYRRADSYKEAVNLYEEELHRFQMEELQQQILYNTERTAQMTEENLETLQKIQTSTASAARTAKINAVINFATYTNIRKIRKNIRK